MNKTWKQAALLVLFAALGAACADDGSGTPACPAGFIRAGDVCICPPGFQPVGEVCVEAGDADLDVGVDVITDADAADADVGVDVTADADADADAGDLVLVYEQSFESLNPDDPDALANDGWRFFGNVAAADAPSCTDSDQCTSAGSSCENFGGVRLCVKFGYGDPAPTTSGQISALVTDQGGPGQGGVQLSVFSDFECCGPGTTDEGHFNGTDLVETNVFQEFTIPAEWIGRTFTFTFEAKAGNIEGATTAEAFIKTLDPNDGFRTTNDEVFDTTDLPDDWGAYTVTLDMSDPLLEGQILQFGFATVASNFEAAGNFYDNLTFVGGPPAECEENADCPDTGNECTTAVCAAGSCTIENVANDTACTVDSLPGACNEGVCEGLCVGVTCPDNGIECQTDMCDPADGLCKPVNDAENTSCELDGGGTGICDDMGNCAACSLDSQCDDGNECTGNACVEGACVSTGLDGDACTVAGLPGTCDAGVCVSNLCEYDQDFEALDDADADALSNDGWLYFGNVYDSTGAFKFGFGPFAAPTTTGQISSIATGEGGPDQGEQQLNVFSNYDCCQPGEGHFGTDLVETLVFQEIASIPADFIGQIFEFTFDAKRGNIEGATTAQAFIKTIDPGAGFATTNNIVLDTTSLPTDWATYTVTLDMSDSLLEGQILQFGFSTVASNFEGAGNFYDNVAFGPQGCGGECAVDGDCPDTGNECTSAVCAAGTCETENVADGTTCDGDTGTCSAGVCVECTLDSECEDDNACTDNTCDAGACVFTNDDTNACMVGDLPGACNAGVCEGLCEGVTCPDNGIECQTDVCDPADGGCKPENDPIDTACDLTGPGTGICDGAGNCVACTLDSQCEDNNDCTDNACDAGACVFTNDDTNTCMVGDLPGTCNAGVCEGLCEGVTCPDNGIECQTDVCDPTDGGCKPENDAIDTGCDLGTGADSGVCDGAGTCVECNIDAQCDTGEVCVSNVCEVSGLACEYEQDFEALDPANPDALSNDGWLYFGNVYDSGGVFKFGFGPFAAPTTSGHISAIATGEGGPDQGTNQLNVFSNYDCCQPGEGHFGTDLVETLVFQEIASIPPEFIGQVFTFTFDAKRGDIAGATTAQAFIKTLDPGAGFATTNNVVLDTTSLPTDWATYTITLDLSDPLLQGQILQFGFSTVASNFDPAGNFYDNISFCTPGGDECVVDADCPDTGNDCTDAVCNAGTCETSNVADGTACDGDTGTCDAGVCVPTTIACEYEQDFESLDPADPDALSNDGWLYFGNVYDSGGVFKFGFGPFAAPTTSGHISAIATGEGGPDQGTNQLNVFSNYDCCQPGEGHFGTDLVETIVFQEIASIPSDFIGQVFTFTFDAKRGNIAGATTAEAFIRTLDPGAGFATTNNVVLDTTALPTDWATYTITLDLSDPLLQGQILQFGFSTVASNFEPAGNFYDNASFGPQDCGGGGGGDCVPPALPNLTINGDFETGDACGWEFFPNDGTFAATMAQANGGLWSGNLVASVPGGGGPPSFPVIKQANIGIGTVQPNSTATISFDLFGSVSGAGGVFFAEFFSELSGGGTSSSVILGGGPLFPSGTWTNYTFNTPTGDDVSGGVTLQLKADCGASPGCTVDAYIDNVSVTVP